MTKGKSRLDTVRLVNLIGFATLPGRPDEAPLRARKWNIGRPVAPPKAVDSELLDAGMCEVGCSDDGKFEEGRSDISHHYNLCSHLVEGRSLHSSRAFPPKGDRILYSALDVHTGEEVFNIHHAQGGVDSEPDLMDLTSNEIRLFMLVSWLVVG